MTSRLPISVDDGERPLLATVNDLQNLRQNSADKMTGSYDNLVQHAAVCVHAGLHGRLHVGLREDNIALRVALFYHSSQWRVFYLFVNALNLCMAFFENNAGEPIQAFSLQFYLLFVEILMLGIYVADLALLYRYTGKTLFKSRWVRLRVIMIIAILVDTLICIATPTRVGHYTRFLRPMFLIERLRNVRKIAGAIIESTPKILNVLVLLMFHIIFFGVVAYVLFRGIEGTTGDHLHVSYADRSHCNFLRYDLSDDMTLNFCSTFSKNCMDYFSSFYSSTLQLFILLTTANYPDVMMPVYECEPATSIFFIVYVSIGLYFLMSLVLAVVYSHFAERTKNKFIKHHEKRNRSLQYAFQLLVQAKRLRQSEENMQSDSITTNRGKNASRAKSSSHTSIRNSAVPLSAEQLEVETIHLPEWINMLRFLSAKIPAEVAESLFYLRRSAAEERRRHLGRRDFNSEDDDEDKDLYLDQFKSLVRFSRIRIRKKSQAKPPMVKLKSLHRLAKRVSVAGMTTRRLIKLRLQKIISTKYWIYGFDALVFINSIILILILAPGGHKYHHSLRTISEVFLYIFTIEVVTKIVAMNFYSFWTFSKMNQLDFVTVLCGVIVNISSLWVDMQNKQAVQFLSISITFVRMIRLLRVLRVLSEFRSVTNTIVHVLPALMRYFAVLLGIFYMYAIIGMELFGSRLDVTKLEYPYNKQLNESSYVLSDYQNNNFDSLQNSFVTLFEQMVVNNWPIVMEGCVAATSSWAVLYFISFYLVTVITVMNVLIAFLLDAYQAHKDNFDTKNSIAFGKSAQRQNSSNDEPWLKRLKRVSQDRGINILDYDLQLKSHAGDVYKAMYGNTAMATRESFSSEPSTSTSRNSFDLIGGSREGRLSEADSIHLALDSIDDTGDIVDDVLGLDIVEPKQD